MDPQSGGPCQGLRNLLPELAALGVGNEVVSLDAPDAAFLGKDPFVIHAIGQGTGPWGYNKALIPWLVKHMPSYDLVVVHGLWLHSSYATGRAARILRRQGKSVPYYVMPHGMLDPYFQKAEGRKIKAIRNYLYWKLLEGRLVNEAAGVLFTCEEELRLARHSFSPYKPAKELNIGYGIKEVPQADAMGLESVNTSNGIPAGKPYILVLSRIHEKKGIDLAVAAYQEIAKTTTGLPTLVIAGPGLDTDYGRSLLEAAAGSPSIVFTGMLAGEAKWAAFRGAEAYLLPSHQENFGISVVEAMASSVPVLITNKVNIWREIKDGRAGIIGDDTLAGVTAMLREWLSLSPEVKKQMGADAFNCFRNKFFVGEVAKQVALVLKKEVGNG
ncbi:MAG: glycosyltransferase [Chitinophagaceae bacterium]|nr:MAG: glycosyltransferase [Chitinophagaceae bacterium]